VRPHSTLGLVACLFSCAVGLAAAAVAREAEPEPWGAIELLEASIAPGGKQRLSFVPYRSFEAGFIDTAVWVVRGAKPGPTLCITAAVHGDEINGAEIARRVFAAVQPAELAGTLIVMPAVNAYGFRTGNRYMPDRRDLNRSFPGKREGSVSSLVAHAVFSRVIQRCDALIDLHTGSFQRTNLPQIRVDLSNERALELARHFGVGVVLGGEGPSGSLRREATDAGIPAIIYEAGEPLRFQREEIEHGAEGVHNAMAFLGLEGRSAEAPRSRVFRRTKWVRVPVGGGGIFFNDVALGARVAEGERLGTVTRPDDFREVEIRAPRAGEVIGMAVPQIVLSGYALFHLGYDAE
jgi:predicted deacylase